jgi:predicted alpha/beta superfamily hydrolase
MRVPKLNQAPSFSGVLLGLLSALVAACGGTESTARVPAAPCGCNAARPCPAGFACSDALCLALPPPAPAPLAASVTAEPAPPAVSSVVLAGTEVHELVSKTNARSYEIMVAPAAKTAPGALHPVVYVLDGYWDFPLVATMRGSLKYDAAIPDVIVVGIGYTGFGPDAPELADLRKRDLTPTPGDSPAPSAGGGPEFLRFLGDELIPYIESHYPADPKERVLAGASLGGLFALYALFERPGLFEGYVAMTPAVRWDDGFIVKREREFKKSHAPLSARVWLSVGGDEDAKALAADIAFFRQLEASRYQGLTLRTRVVEGERHAAMKNESYNRGLRFVLAPLAPHPSK